METFNERKAYLWGYIHLCQDIIKTIQEIGADDTVIGREVIQLERDQIQKSYAELKQITLWFKGTGLDPDEPFNRRVYGGSRLSNQQT